MKNILKLGAICALTLTLLAPTAARAQYGVQKTFWSATLTNTTAFSTNLSAAIDVTQVTDFALNVRCGVTNPVTGTIDIAWQTSADGNWPATNGQAMAVIGQAGWFSIPCTNMGTILNWNTNITVGAVGYWRIAYITNNTVQNMTNAVVTGYIKTQRTRSDY